MTASHAEVEAKLVAVRTFLATCPPRLIGARLVQYRGPDLLRTEDLKVEDLEPQLAACVREGLSVDWLYRSGLLYLRVFDSGVAAPSWERLFAEQELSAVQAILRDAGFDSDS
jgi:hypothetical protein